MIGFRLYCPLLKRSYSLSQVNLYLYVNRTRASVHPPYLHYDNSTLHNRILELHDYELLKAADYFFQQKRHGWTSMKGRVSFWFRIRREQEEIKPEAVFKYFGQKCNRCQSRPQVKGCNSVIELKCININRPVIAATQ